MTETSNCNKIFKTRFLFAPVYFENKAGERGLSFSKSLILRRKTESEERRLKWGRKKNTTSTFKVMLKS